MLGINAIHTATLTFFSSTQLPRNLRDFLLTQTPALLRLLQNRAYAGAFLGALVSLSFKQHPFPFR
jgi:hypothetical protein